MNDGLAILDAIVVANGLAALGSDLFDNDIGSLQTSNKLAEFRIWKVRRKG